MIQRRSFFLVSSLLLMPMASVVAFVVRGPTRPQCVGFGLAARAPVVRNQFQRSILLHMAVETPERTEQAAQSQQFTNTVESNALSNGSTEEPAKELNKTQQMMQQVKEAGVAGVISYALWELGFWALSVPVCLVGYNKITGHWPNLSDPEDLKQLGAEAFAFVNFARFAVPLRIGLALGTTPWIQSNIVDRFMKKDDDEAPKREPVAMMETVTQEYEPVSTHFAENVKFQEHYDGDSS